MDTDKKLETKIFRPSVDFDIKKFDEQILTLMPLSWRNLFDNYERELRDVATVIKSLVEKGETICPQPWSIFRSLSLTPWYDVKVVIVGQDPYYQVESGIPVATGCCFECRKGDIIRRSLENIFLVMKKTVKGFELPADGDLSKWAVQGVLLLNATLTTRENEANAHEKIWQFFPMRLLQYLSKVKKNVVYMLWGNNAKAYGKFIQKNTNLLLESSHPVAQGKANTFIHCNHFNETNDYLVKTGQSPIDWTL
jgi:uracil-DNA glycosylase